MNEQKTYLFTLTITPVQSFISQARKTKDLFVGSEILSSLMKKVLEEIDKQEIIFPQNRDFVSNKFVAKLENRTEDEIRTIGKSLENSINKDFINLIFKNTNKCDSAFYDFFKVYWVAVELGDDYPKSYKELEQNLGAVKNLRTFKQNLQLKGKAKCVLCGERNQEEENNGDKLCLICYTKRVCTKDNKGSYPSTAKIALLDWLHNIDYDEVKKLDNFDEQWFLENDKDEIKTFIKYKKLDTSTQKKYYALIQFDIDDLGKNLSELDERGQKELSTQLGEFAQKAKDIVDKCGKTIYAGGDDFLGFVNLAYLFEVLDDIQKAFQDEVKASFSDLTYSTSIVITHYKTQLDKVLKYSKITLENAKSQFKIAPKAFKFSKNAMAITYITKSNNVSTTYFYKDRIDTFSLLNTLLKDKNTPILSSKFIFNLEQEFKRVNLDEINDIAEIDIMIDMLNIELKRLIKRASADFDKDINKKKRQLQELYQKLQEFSYDNWDNQNKIFDFENYIKFFKIANAINGEK